MFSVVSSDLEHHHLKQLRELFVEEWELVDSFKVTIDDFIVPSPLLAIDGQKLLGGLAFTGYPVPGSEETGLWINALLVVPKNRGMGIGSQLVLAAEVEAARSKKKELYVYTNVPELYQKLGWLKVDSDNENTVLKRAIAKRVCIF